MSRALLVLAALVLFASAPTARAEDTALDSANEAAVVALHAVSTISPYYEYSGVILQRPDGKFVLPIPSTQFAGDSSHSDVDPTSYKAPIVAGYHTHPCLPYSHVPGIFSPQDLRWARVTKTPEYMLDMCTGDVHLYDPATDKLTPEQVLEGAAVRVVGHVPVKGTPLEREDDPR